MLSTHVERGGLFHAHTHAAPSNCHMQAGELLQIELLTILVKLDELPTAQAAEVYRLLLDDSRAVRHAVAELVASVQEAQGQSFLQSQQVRTACTGGKDKSPQLLAACHRGNSNFSSRHLSLGQQLMHCQLVMLVSHLDALLSGAVVDLLLATSVRHILLDLQHSVPQAHAVQIGVSVPL